MIGRRRAVALMMAVATGGALLAAPAQAETVTRSCRASALVNPSAEPPSCTTGVIQGPGAGQRFLGYLATGTGRTRSGNVAVKLEVVVNGIPVPPRKCGPQPGSCTASFSIEGPGAEEPTDVQARCTWNTNTLSVFLTLDCAQTLTSCTRGTVGCGWEDGEVVTHIQSSWGDSLMPGGATLIANYDSVYAATFGIVEVGIPGAAGFSMSFTSSNAVLDYQPSSGPAAALDADLVDPTSSASGVFGGEVLALRFNIDFADGGHTPGTSNARFGNLTLCNFTGSLGGLNGISVRAFLDIVSTALGGGSTSYSITDLHQTSIDVNNSFDNGVVSLFAQRHLFNGACPP